MEDTLQILVVDDDEIDRMAVRRALNQSGISTTITEAATCAEALARLAVETFDCTFVDYGLPDRNGLDLVKCACALNVQHPLVVLTGQGDERIAVELMKAGATDYMPKSQISPANLAQVMRNAIRIARAEREVIETSEQLKRNNELLVRQNRDLEQQRDQIELQNLQREDFISHLTHDLRTPLVAANMMYKLFEQEAFCPLSPEMHNALDAMYRSNQNLLELVNTMLEVNRYESGHKQLTMTPCDMWDIMQAVVEELQPLAQYKSIDLHLISEHPQPESLKILGDCLEIRRALTNLVGNALKFTDVGSVKLKLGFCPVSEGENTAINGWVTVDVADTGLGMSAEEQAIMFQRFRTGKHRQAGSGLGLHLVARIITEHSGTISVTSEPGRGSLFKVRLPAKG
ncbi:hybrid sensor histidine kinase/response regulator [Chamaesiphon polymorphus]|uniref:histidine kinase n=1 Tax=Chamaesiphon polymorphus CCALA 037 TaxID=2107692 RepID=A0A2T1FWQ7_9CYAN|nr:hybrid sensor histidine kinase/response regulator [Chamaesiphon polymorphus]PSB49428.1 hybrid sensor histidine kinase/response regulator [Chamaesiphon polymorphus CCALA 037]